jgi:hypothetical protein
MNLKEYVEQTDFGSNWETLPKGDTYIVLTETEVEPIEVEFDGVKKTRYKLKTEDKEYMVGIQVIKGIQENSSAEKVRVTKAGEGKSTHYTVVPVID